MLYISLTPRAFLPQIPGRLRRPVAEASWRNIGYSTLPERTGLKNISMKNIVEKYREEIWRNKESYRTFWNENMETSKNIREGNHSILSTVLLSIKGNHSMKAVRRKEVVTRQCRWANCHGVIREDQLARHPETKQHREAHNSMVKLASIILHKRMQFSIPVYVLHYDCAYVCPSVYDMISADPSLKGERA